MEVKLAVGEPLDNEHDAAACWTAQAGRLRWVAAGRCIEQRTAAFERSTPSAVGEESEVPDANQTARQDVKQEATQELVGGNCHDFLLAR